MNSKEEISKHTIDEMLDDLAVKYKETLASISTIDLVDELSHRDGVDVTMVDPGEAARMRISGPAVVLTVFD